MIISHKYKFIFIKTAKTAGTSIEVFLSQYCGEDDIVTPIWPSVEPHRARNYSDEFYNHIPATAIKSLVAEDIWDNYFKFCVERNPWDKALSHYCMENDRAEGKISFEEYLNHGSFAINYPKYTDPDGNIMVDKILKYESLTSELANVFQKLNISFNGTLGVRAKSEHRKDRRSYSKIFTPEQRVIIDKAFAKEIEMHGYVF